MKSTGMVRRIDELGRIVLPIEMRRSLGINIRDSVEIFVEGNKIILKKHEDKCIFCGSTKDISKLHGKSICENCMIEISKIDL